MYGPDYDPDAAYSHRFAYFPSRVENGVLKAEACLLPGQPGTPERAVLTAGRPTPDWQEVVERQSPEEMLPLLSWLHKHGQPQVRQGHPRFDL